MAITLNIIEHELRAFGRVVRSNQENPSFSDFRLFIEPALAIATDVLYLCEKRPDVEKAIGMGHDVIYVGVDDDIPDERAVLSILGDTSIYVIFNALLDLALKLGTWERDMDAIRFRDGNLQELLDLSSPLLENNVVILDPSLKLIAYTKDVPCDDPITVELIDHGYHTEENISKFRLHKRFAPWTDEDGFVINDSYEICKYVTVVRSFRTKSSFSIIIVMMCNVTEPEDYLLDIYDMFASRVAYYAKRDYPDDKPSGNAIDTFLKDLFLNRSMGEAEIRERCSILGIPFETRFCLFYIKNPEGVVPQSRLLADVSRLVAPAKTVLVNGAVAVLCFNCRSDRCALHCVSNACPLGQMSLSSRINDMMMRYDLGCGRSSKFTTLSSAPTAFEQAKFAYNVSRRREIRQEKLGLKHNWNRIASFDSCVVDYLVSLVQGDGAELLESTYAGHVLEAVNQHDLDAKTDNYRFLYEYLMGERRASVVAEKLHMHRNNVKYRIDKIESQYGIDTSDPALRFDFLLAYRIREADFVRFE